jgi:hypothetical protein
MTTMISGGGWMSRATRMRARRVSNGRVGQTSPGLVQRSRARVEGGARPTCRPTANVGPGHVTRSQVRVVGRARPRAPIPRCPLLCPRLFPASLPSETDLLRAREFLRHGERRIVGFKTYCKIARFSLPFVKDWHAGFSFLSCEQQVDSVLRYCY